MALAFYVSADVLLFDEEERQLAEDWARHVEALAQLDPDEQAAVRGLIEGALLRHKAKRVAAS